MHFGRTEHLSKVNFTLPRNTERTERFFALPRTFETKVYLGCPIWSSRTWVGSFYPRGTKSSEFLKFYAKHFNCVEVNSTFYHLIDKERITSWQSEVPPDFRFCPKVFRDITENLHRPDLEDLTIRFCDSIRNFSQNLGLTFAQFSDTFHPRQAALLAKFINLWPSDLPLAIELRHPAWFHQQSLPDDLINFLYRQKIATVITDTPGRRDVLHTSFTQPKILIRFQGCEQKTYDEPRLREWSTRLHEWQKHSLEEIYFFTHQPTDEHIPDTGIFIQSLFNEKN